MVAKCIKFDLQISALSIVREKGKKCIYKLIRTHAE